MQNGAIAPFPRCYLEEVRAGNDEGVAVTLLAAVNSTVGLQRFWESELPGVAFSNYQASESLLFEKE